MGLRKWGVTERPWAFLLPAGAGFAAIPLFPVAYVLWPRLANRDLTLWNPVGSQIEAVFTLTPNSKLVVTLKTTWKPQPRPNPVTPR